MPLVTVVEMLEKGPVMSLIEDEFILPSVRSSTPMPRALRVVLLFLLLMPLAGCDPIFDIAGAYFPAWILCIIAGGIGTLIARNILVRLSLDSHLWWKSFAYFGVFITLSCWIWIIFFIT
jgi:hypothetical protein